MSIQLCAGHFSIRSRHRDEAESSDLSSVAIRWHKAVSDCSEFFKSALDLILASIERKITNVELDLWLSFRVEGSISSRSRSGTTFTLGPGFIHTNLTSIQLSLVHFRDGIFRGVTRS
jgi:hypothetical protein